MQRGPLSYERGPRKSFACHPRTALTSEQEVNEVHHRTSQ
ncbi:hypothetical protein MICRO11B_120079 [Micrococcus luteus]|nr:hypothetical protein MICRO11B_120079 [Micrococcus luteus]